MRRPTTLVIALLVGSLGCSPDADNDACKSDDDCDGGLFCDDGVCKCRTDDACGDPKVWFCNDFGNCQPRPPCLGNQDCEEGTICNSADVTGGKCIPETNCGSSVHCPLGQFCDPNTTTCKPGCRSTGDCPLGAICIAGSCTTNSPCDVCPAQPDPDPTYCDFGEKCTFEGSCEAVPHQSGLCKQCGEGETCEQGLACIMDTEEAAGVNYCTPTCTIDADCPNGYGDCGGIIFVAGSCVGDGDCDNGGRCVSSSESSYGWCEIVDELECGLQAGVCDILTGMCLVHPCEADGDCAPFGTTCTDDCGLYGSCTTGLGTKICDLPCSSDADCYCVNHTCTGSTLPCSTNEDCAATYTEIETATGAAYGACESNVKVCGKEAGVSCDDLDGDAVCRSLE